MEKNQSLSRLQKLCSKAEYCSRDIYRKALRDLEGDAEAATSVTEALVAEGYVNDARYAAAFSREKAGLTGWGPIKIRHALKAKGLSEGDIASGLAEVDSEAASAKLQRLLASKAKTLEGDPAFKLKLIRFGLSRGYDYPAVEDAISKI